MGTRPSHQESGARGPPVLGQPPPKEATSSLPTCDLSSQHEVPDSQICALKPGVVGAEWQRGRPYLAVSECEVTGASQCRKGTL